jgi:Bacterial HORMA domain family 1
MSYSFSYTESSTFTVTHARHIAAKVATDLKRMQRFYGNPSDADIARYEVEVIALVKAGYLGAVTYGYKKDGKWIEPTLRYTARELTGSTANDDDPGRVRPGADISGAVFHSYLTYSAAWEQLDQAERASFKATLPFFRNGAAEPGVSGYLSNDRTYSSGGRALDRSAIRSFG